jgi:hypothetical protein
MPTALDVRIEDQLNRYALRQHSDSVFNEDDFDDFYEKNRIGQERKADFILEELKANERFADLRPVFVSVGGGDGAELHRLMSKWEGAYGFLMERSKAGVKRAKENEKQFAGLLQVVEGRISPHTLQNICKQAADRIAAREADALVVSCHAIIHELYDRSDNFNPDELFASMFENQDIPIWFTYREPCTPEFWPAEIYLKADCSCPLLLRLATTIQSRHRALQQSPQPSYSSDARACRLARDLAMETIVKLVYLDDFQHDIEERSTAAKSSELEHALSVCIGREAQEDRRALITRCGAVTSTFQKGWLTCGILARADGRCLAMPESQSRVVAWRVPRSSAVSTHANGDDRFAWVEKHFSDVSYHALPQPICFTDDKSSSYILDATFAPDIYLRPPAKNDIRRQIHKVISLVKAQKGDTAAYTKDEEYITLLRSDDVNRLMDKDKNPLWGPAASPVDDIEPQAQAGSTDIASFRFLKDSGHLATAKLDEIKNVLLRNALGPEYGDGFRFNGPSLAVSSLHVEDDSAGKPYKIPLTVRWTDYYSYRTMAACSDAIRAMLPPSVAAPDNLKAYLDNKTRPFLFQDGIHLALGMSIILKTSDNFLFIRRRSHSAAERTLAGKLFVSAVEGIRDTDIVENTSPPKFRSIREIVDNRLEHEVFGSQHRHLLKQTGTCHLTGLFLFKPNMGMNLCCLVESACKLEDVMKASEQADHAHEFVRQRSICPEFTRTKVEQFFKGTISGPIANETWDEGGLLTVLLAARTLPK